MSTSTGGTRPKVSVSMITYNHEAYIGQAIESVMTQEADFPIEAVVGEDCSPDSTRDIILRLQERHPGRIHLSDYPENIGGQANFTRTILACTGEYVALLDGDDYFSSPHKIRRQVEFLDSHPQYSMCFHPVRDEHEELDKYVDSYPPGRRDVYRLRDLAGWIGISTSSVVFRNGLFTEFPEWFWGCPVGDWPLFFMLAQHGDIGYIDEILSVHRIHGGGNWAGMRKDRISGLRSNVEMVKILGKQAAPSERPAFDAAIYSRYYDLAHEHLEGGDRSEARSLIRRCLADRGYDRSVYALEPLKSWMHLYLPGLYRWIHARREEQRARKAALT